MTPQEYVEKYNVRIELGEKPGKPPERPCPHCVGTREWAYDIYWPDGGQMTVSESYHLCRTHFEEWDMYQEQCMH